MTGADRQVRQAELEAAVQVLVERGWAVERLAYEDEEDEPYRAFVTLRVDRTSALRGKP